MSENSQTLDAGAVKRPQAAQVRWRRAVEALRRVSLCPWRIGAITAAALVLLHHQHGHIT